jgi:hypothetical protein
MCDEDKGMLQRDNSKDCWFTVAIHREDTVKWHSRVCILNPDRRTRRAGWIRTTGLQMLLIRIDRYLEYYVELSKRSMR